MHHAARTTHHTPHTLTLTRTHTHTLSLSLTLSHSPTHSFSLTLTLTHLHSHSHTLSLIHSLTSAFYILDFFPSKFLYIQFNLPNSFFLSPFFFHLSLHISPLPPPPPTHTHKPPLFNCNSVQHTKFGVEDILEKQLCVWTLPFEGMDSKFCHGSNSIDNAKFVFHLLLFVVF